MLRNAFQAEELIKSTFHQWSRFELEILLTVLFVMACVSFESEIFEKKKALFDATESNAADSGRNQLIV